MIPVVGVFRSMRVMGEQPGWPEFCALLLVMLALATVLVPPRVRAAGPARDSGHAA
jgi:hypothetical protein